MKAICIHTNGGPEVLQWETVALPDPAPDEVQVRHTAIGLNFSDINVRNGGFYRAAQPTFPLIIGNEAAGVVVSAGANIKDFPPGTRVAYAGTGGLFFENTGAYAEFRNVPASCLVKLPADISDEQAAAIMLKGLTASVIVNKNFCPKAGDVVLIHAAASGVGSLLAQWCAYLGATVIGTVGSAQKACFAQAHGCQHTILYRQSDFVPAVKELVPAGVDAVLDGVGKDTFVRSLDCVKPFGTVVNYGNASGPVPPFDLLLLAQKGCLGLHRPGFGFYAATQGDRDIACHELFSLVRNEHLKINIGSRYPLSDAASAHRDVEAGKHVGSVLLIP